MRWTRTGSGLGLLAILVASSAIGAQELVVTGHVTLINRAARSKPADNSNAVVWLVSLPTSAGSIAAPLHHSETPPGSRHRFRLVQKGKRFMPHVLVVPAGSVVDFPNLDPVFHNVFSLFEGKRFDLGLYEAGSTRAVHFDAPGICYIFCNIHPEMSAVVLVMATPYYGVTNRDGEITIPGVAPGSYHLNVWHERCLPELLRDLTREVTLDQSHHSLGIIRLTASSDLLLTHKNKYGRDYDRPAPSAPLYQEP